MKCVGILKTNGGVQMVYVMMDEKDDFDEFWKNHPQFFILAQFKDGMMVNIKYRANAKTEG